VPGVTIEMVRLHMECGSGPERTLVLATLRIHSKNQELTKLGK
jgi:hypothetical protein